MGLSERRLVAALVALALVAIAVAWWLASALAIVSDEVVSPGIVMSGSEGAQSAQSGASQSGVPIAQHPGGEAEHSPSSPTNGNVAPVETPTPLPPPATWSPTPIVPAPPIDLDDDDYDDDIDDADDDRDDD